MGEILSRVFILPVRVMLIFCAIILILLWIVSIIWVYRDAKTREAPAVFWALIAVIPVAGLVAYCLLRPPLNTTDATEQQMNIELIKRRLADYGNCPNCGEQVQKDYITCPQCCTPLRNVCSACNKPLEPDWQMCPYCGKKLPRQSD